MRIIMLGAPGAGKGTQAKQISEKFGIPHISTGDIFRSNLKEGTELGKKAKEYMDQGLLVPDDLTCDLVVDRISKEDARGGYVLDGFPRTIAQANALAGALEERGERIDAVIDVDVPDAYIMDRMSGRRFCGSCGASYHIVFSKPEREGICDACGGALEQRHDDEPGTVKKRLSVYHEQTKPLIDYYESQGVLTHIDGTKAIEAVFADIRAALGS